MAKDPDTRDYKRERRLFQSSPEARERHAARNRARRHLEKQGKVRKHDGKDVDHKNHNAEDNSADNLRVRARDENRADNGSHPGM